MAARAGVIAAGDQRTAEAGAEVLRAGGNAVDAICAAACVAFVVEAPLCGPAGGGVLLAGEAGRAQILDCFSVVPGRGLARAPSLDFHDVSVDFGPTTQVFHVGRGSVAVPGTMLGLLEAHRRHGRTPWSTLIEPAVAVANAGVAPSEQLTFIIELLRPILELSPATAALFFDARGQPSLSNPRLAQFLDAIAREGEALIHGPFADALVEAFGPAHGGLLSAEDLTHYAPVWREPLRIEWGDSAILTNPPPSSGGPLVGVGLELARALELGAMPWLGPRHLGELAALLGAVDQVRAAGLDQRSRDPELAPRAHAQQRRRRNLGSTTHISVLDADGQLAALTMSNGEGCGYTLEAFGVHLNNFLGEDDINPGGFHQQAPGTKMTTMMAPTAVLRGGAPTLVLGTGGSNRIRSALLLTLLHTLGSSRTLGEAVLAPRLHVEGERLWYERPGLDAASEAALREAWPDATAFEARNMFFGGVHAVGRRDDGGLIGFGDPRRGGAVRLLD